MEVRWPFQSVKGRFMKYMITYLFVFFAVFVSNSNSYATQYEVVKADAFKKLLGVADKLDSQDNEIEKWPDAIIYHSVSIDGSEMTTSQFNKEVWYESGRQNFRRQMLEQFYFANTREKSSTGRKVIACYTGSIDRILEFLADPKTNVEIDGVDKVMISVSEDKKMIGIEYNVIQPNTAVAIHRHFRMPHCIQGSKAPLLSVSAIKTAKSDKKHFDRMIASIQSDEKRKPNAAPSAGVGQENRPDENSVPENQGKGPVTAGAPHAANPSYDGYTPQDVVSPEVKAAYEKTIKRTLPTFTVRANYADFKPTEKSRPWVGKVGDIRLPGEAEKLSQIILDYFLDSLLLDSKNIENNLIAQNSPSTKSQWCHMPWLNVGEAGREAIHGLTKERDMEPTALYPETQAFSFKKTGGSDWGIGFYNDIACAALNKVFGNYTGGKIEKPDPQFIQPTALDQSTGEIRNNLFPDGSASVKVLFTTADLLALKNSFTWTANTSLPKQTARALRPMRLVQIDVAIKDRKIIGTDPDADHWLMLTYYFDDKTVDNYLFANSTLKKDPRFVNTGLSPFLKMRPIGVQFGFDPTTSRIFKGSKTNTTVNDYHGTNPNLLNGPADNPTSSCLSCHGAAGTTTKMVPGVKDYAHYKNMRKKGTLDFSMQLAFAKRNYETRPQMTK